MFTVIFKKYLKSLSDGVLELLCSSFVRTWMQKEDIGGGSAERKKASVKKTPQASPREFQGKYLVPTATIELRKHERSLRRKRLSTSSGGGNKMKKKSK